MDRFTGIHAVREALEAGSAFDRIVIAKGRQDSRIEGIVQLARARGISVRFEDRLQLDRLANTRDHQGVVGIAAVRPAVRYGGCVTAIRRPSGGMQAVRFRRPHGCAGEKIEHRQIRAPTGRRY